MSAKRAITRFLKDRAYLKRSLYYVKDVPEYGLEVLVKLEKGYHDKTKIRPYFTVTYKNNEGWIIGSPEFYSYLDSLGNLYIQPREELTPEEVLVVFEKYLPSWEEWFSQPLNLLHSQAWSMGFTRTCPKLEFDTSISGLGRYSLDSFGEIFISLAILGKNDEAQKLYNLFKLSSIVSEHFKNEIEKYRKLTQGKIYTCTLSQEENKRFDSLFDNIMQKFDNDMLDVFKKDYCFIFCRKIPKTHELLKSSILLGKLGIQNGSCSVHQAFSLEDGKAGNIWHGNYDWQMQIIPMDSFSHEQLDQALKEHSDNTELFMCLSDDRTYSLMFDYYVDGERTRRWFTCEGKVIENMGKPLPQENGIFADDFEADGELDMSHLLSLAKAITDFNIQFI